MQVTANSCSNSTTSRVAKASTTAIIQWNSNTTNNNKLPWKNSPSHWLSLELRLHCVVQSNNHKRHALSLRLYYIEDVLHRGLSVQSTDYRGLGVHPWKKGKPSRVWRSKHVSVFRPMTLWCKGKYVLLFGLPGAFISVMIRTMVPEYDAARSKLWTLGIDEVYIACRWMMLLCTVHCVVSVVYWVLGVGCCWCLSYRIPTVHILYSCSIVILHSNHKTTCVGRGKKPPFSLHVQSNEPFPFYFFSQTICYFEIHFSLFPLFIQTHTHTHCHPTNEQNRTKTKY